MLARVNSKETFAYQGKRLSIKLKYHTLECLLASLNSCRNVDEECKRVQVAAWVSVSV